MSTFLSVELFIPCNKRVQNKVHWMSTKYIMLLVIEPQGPEPGLAQILGQSVF